MSQLPPQRNFGRFQAPAAKTSLKYPSFVPNNYQTAAFSQSNELSFQSRLTQQEDTMSVYSDSTMMQPPASQDSLKAFRGELCEMFKLLVETNQKNTVQMVEA